MASDTVNLIAQLDGELITYLPFGGAPKSIRVAIDRGRPSHQVQQAGTHAYSVNTRELLIAKDATDGLLAITEQKDKVQFKRNLSDAAVTEFTVKQVLREDNGVAGGGGAFVVLVQA